MKTIGTWKNVIKENQNMKNIDDKLAKGKHLKLAITFYENEIEDNNV